MKQFSLLNEYQNKAYKYAVYPSIGGDDKIYLALGLAGEAGEVADKIKKIYRDKGGVYSDNDLKEIMLELGDVLWYVSEMSRVLGFSLNDVAQENINKLESRFNRGVIGGSGDNR